MSREFACARDLTGPEPWEPNRSWTCTSRSSDYLRRPGAGRWLSRPSRKDYRTIAKGGCRLAVAQMGPASRHREPHRSRRQHRRGTGISLKSRRLYIALIAATAARHQSKSLSKLGIRPLKFEPIVVMAEVPNALIVNPNKVKSSNLSELIETEEKSDRVTAATQGNGTTSHLRRTLPVRGKLRDIPIANRSGAPGYEPVMST